MQLLWKLQLYDNYNVITWPSKTVTPRGGGGGYSSQILVGMGRGKVKNGPGLREEAPDLAWKCGLRNCQDASGWRSGRSLTSGWAGPAVGGNQTRWKLKKTLSKLKKVWKWWYRLRNGKIRQNNIKWWCSGTDFLVICENDMLRNGNLGLKMRVSRAA